MNTNGLSTNTRPTRPVGSRRPARSRMLTVTPENARPTEPGGTGSPSFATVTKLSSEAP